ncbi:hypothetical protein CW362_24290 [Streptomyces populi]|uniref:YDG domain-containing protein n=1 Tax=Streptomyces populi TaxID=2058924 RepID=A0A2I0SKN2_9ACTN|nr:YDG/SRA domain-containing protein [Streptomyces populi]PKT70479.1 hypothetical protein CW362_24290 [Streptomyces populi]
MIGEVPDVVVGQRYESRRLVHEAGAHRPLRARICGTKKTGAESIIVSGDHKDDEDSGKVIIYTGHGGQDASKNQVGNQTLEDPGNAALVTSHTEGLPVRVIRGAHKGSVYAPATGYRYDGLYRVTSYGSRLGLDGFLIWQFRLETYQDTPAPEVNPAFTAALDEMRRVRRLKPDDRGSEAYAEWQDQMATALESMTEVLPVEADRLWALARAKSARREAVEIRSRRSP